MGWVDIRTNQHAQQIAKNTKRGSPAPAPTPSADAARIAHLEGRVAALEARLQWAIDVIQYQQRQATRPTSSAPETG